MKQEQLSESPQKSSIPNAASIKIKKEVTTPPARSPPEENSISPVSQTYIQRRQMLSEYQELFKALWRLPDKEVQQKVLRCINAKHRTVSTQTDPVEIFDDMTNTPKGHGTVEIINTNQESISSPNDSEPSKPATPKKRKRKRKVSLPQANKESRVAVAHKRQMAKMRPQNQQQEYDTQQTTNGGVAKRSRLDSNISDISYLNYIDDLDMEDIQFNVRSKEKLYQNIIKDCVLADITLENGLLPIHDSIVKKQFYKLNIQIFIWKDWKGVDLNNLTTDDDEDLLQLAITNNCSPDIINLLLTKGVNSNSIDGEGNTVVHLAVLNDLEKSSLDHLVEHIDLKLLLSLNDDGYTALHLAIRQDCYLIAESILNVIDKRLSGDIFYKRGDDILETDEIRKTNFKSYYENVCLQMEIDDESDRRIIRNHDIKQKLLQAPDMRSGNTALFFAIENQSEHLIYFLLAHLTDPRTENLSGQDCKNFFSEFGKTLNLSLNIDSAMEKVIKLLS